MPHAGLMNENVLGPGAGPLRRARLHIRGGKEGSGNARYLPV